MAEINFAGFAPELAPGLADQVVGFRTPTSGGERRTQFAAILALFKNNLGAITVASVNGVTIAGSSSPALSVIGTASVSGINTGDQDLSGYLTQAAAAATYLTKAEASTTYLTQANASATYLSKAEASSTYLTQANAAATYLTQANAAATYLSKAEAAATYQPLSAALSALAGGSAFVRFIGPTTSIKEFTLPDASGTLLTTANAVVSITGTANEIAASPATGAVTLSLPAALAFTGKTITGGTFNGPTLTGPALGTPISGVATNLTGTALGLTAGNVITNANLSGDVSSVGNVTTLATVNAQVGTFGSSGLIPVVTVNGKGLITSITTQAVTLAANNLTGTTLAANVVSASLNSITPTGGTLTVTGAIAATITGGGQAIGVSSTTTTGVYQRFSTTAGTKGFLGTGDQVLPGGSVNDMVLDSQTGTIRHSVAGTAITTTSATGLAVTGDTITTGQFYNPGVGAAGAYRWGSSSNGSTGQIGWFSTSDVFLDFLGTLHVRRLTGGTNTIMDVTGTGIAVTGNVTATRSLESSGPIPVGGASKITVDQISSSVSRIIAWGPNPSTAASLTLGAISSDATVGSTTIATVTQNGLSIAGHISATGTISASGRISGTNISLLGNQINESVTNALTAIAINYAGYADGTTQFRDLDIYNGKNVKVANFSNAGLAVTGNVKGGGNPSTPINASAFSGYFVTGQNGINIESTDDASGAAFVVFANSGGTPIGSINRVTTTNAVVYNTTSDARLKTNVRDFTGADSGPIIDGLRPRWFDWKRAGKDGCNIIGLIAQEEAAVEPALMRCGAVTAGDDGDDVGRQWQRSDSALVPILIAELKALRARTAMLEAKFLNN